MLRRVCCALAGLAALAWLSVSVPAQAQNGQTGSAESVIPGFLSTAGCPSVNLTPCFFPSGIPGAITNPTSTLTLTSTTTAYTVGQLIANNATAGSVTNPSFTLPNGNGTVQIGGLRLSTNDTTSTAWGTQTIQIDLWSGPVGSSGPTWTNGDRGAWSPATGTANHLGAFTCLMSAEYGDGAYAECYPAVGNSRQIKLPAGTTVWWSPQAVTGSGVTGASKTFTLTVEAQN